MIIYCIEDGSEKAVMETLQLSCEVQKRPSYILTSLLRGSLGAAGSRLSPRLGQWFVSKGLYMHKQAVVLVS